MIDNPRVALAYFPVNESPPGFVECLSCGATVARWYTNAVDACPVCEACAVSEYKARNPLTWDSPARLVSTNAPVVC